MGHLLHNQGGSGIKQFICSPKLQRNHLNTLLNSFKRHFISDSTKAAGLSSLMDLFFCFFGGVQQQELFFENTSY